MEQIYAMGRCSAVCLQQPPRETFQINVSLPDRQRLRLFPELAKGNGLGMQRRSRFFPWKSIVSLEALWITVIRRARWISCFFTFFSSFVLHFSWFFLERCA